MYFRYNYGDMDGSLIKTKLHWHPHAVADLCFSTDGKYLMILSIYLCPSPSICVLIHISSTCIYIYLCPRPSIYIYVSSCQTSNINILHLYSPQGTYLLSGGEESVLVLWQLATEQKHFRPRLSAPIVGVACCPGDQTFAASLESNGNLKD